MGLNPWLVGVANYEWFEDDIKDLGTGLSQAFPPLKVPNRFLKLYILQIVLKVILHCLSIKLVTDAVSVIR